MSINHKIIGNELFLRQIEESDCTERYLEWLNDPLINQFLETRWEKQDISKIKQFVNNMISSKNCFLFAIIENSSMKHIGNIKIGPVNQFHKFADISYFIGERDVWGYGYGTQAVKLLTEYSFNYLGLETILASVYQSNIASQRVLEKAGYSLQGRILNQLLNSNGDKEDHFYYSINK